MTIITTPTQTKNKTPIQPKTMEPTITMGMRPEKPPASVVVFWLVTVVVLE